MIIVFIFRILSFRPLSLTLSPKEKGDTAARLMRFAYCFQSAKSLSMGEGTNGQRPKGVN